MPAPSLTTGAPDHQLPFRLARVAFFTKSLAILTDRAGKIDWVNPSFERETGYPLREILGKLPVDLLKGADTDPNAIHRIRRGLSQNHAVDEELLIYRRSGKPFWVSFYCTPLGNSDDEHGFVTILENITDQKHHQRNLRIAATVFDRSADAILITDHQNRILDTNPAFTRITGYRREEILGSNPAILSSGRHSRDYYRSMWSSIEKNQQWQGEIWNRRKNGEEYIELLSISRVLLDEPGRFYHVATFSDITRLKNHARELDQATNYDALTGLPNRHLLERRLHPDCPSSNWQHRSFSVCCLDIDCFQALNEQFGMDAGDQVLRLLAHRLTNALRSGDIVARTGGDEFTLVIQSDEGNSVYQRLLNTVNEPLDYKGKALVLTASLGITKYPEDDCDAESLIYHANQAMNTAKEKGRNQWHFFNPGLDRSRRQRRDQLMEMTRALEHGEFELYFQPQIEVSSSRLIGFEALIRWNHPTQGMVLPGEFLPVLENSHLEVPVGRWVVKEALHHLMAWNAAGEDLTVSINVSAQHLLDPGFVTHLESYLRAHPDLNPRLVTIEVLESTALDDIKLASNVLTHCRKLGLQIALDDFGTGFSSLTYLRTLPVDLIKIDQSFVRNLMQNSNDRAIVESVIFLAKRFSKPVLAEGTETPELARMLKKMGCEFIQGYDVARPMPAGQVLDWASNWRHSQTTNPS